MLAMDRDKQIENFRVILEQMLISNKLQVCVEKLKDSVILDVNILRIICNNPDIIPKEIASILNIPNSTLTNAINRLTKKELLERKQNSNDLRSFKLELTSEGKKAMQEHRSGEKHLIEKAFSLLSEEEIPILMGLLEKLAKGL